MVEIHNTVAKVFEDNKEVLEIFECKDEFSDTQNFCDYYGFDIEDSCNAILIKAKKPEEFYAMFCVLGSTRLDVNTKAKNAMGAKRVSFASFKKEFLRIFNPSKFVSELTVKDLPTMTERTLEFFSREIS